MSWLITNRLCNQLFVVAIAVLFICTVVVLRNDTKSSITSRIGLGQHIQSLSRALSPVSDPIPDPSTVVVSIDDLMKGPVFLQQEDPRLIQRIRSTYLYPPSKEEYQLAKPDNDDPSMGQSRQIRNILGDMKDGFFVECGALDGETRSNTLVFEKRYGWSGVLIEGDPKNFGLVIKKNRKAWGVNACLSTQSYPNAVMFKQQFNIGKITNLEKGQHHAGYSEVQCLPFYSVLLALNRTSVDYFSLDVEGAELDILKTIPWDKVDIKTLSVEFIHGGEGKGKADIRAFMQSKGYEVFSQVTNPDWLANDFIFVQRALFLKLKNNQPVKTSENN